MTGREKGIERVGFFGFLDKQTKTQTDGIGSSRRQPAADQTTAQIGRLSGWRASGRSDSLGPGECWTAVVVGCCCGDKVEGMGLWIGVVEGVV